MDPTQIIVALVLYTKLGGLVLEVREEFKGPRAEIRCAAYTKKIEPKKETLAVGCRTAAELASYVLVAREAIGWR